MKRAGARLFREPRLRLEYPRFASSEITLGLSVGWVAVLVPCGSSWMNYWLRVVTRGSSGRTVNAPPWCARRTVASRHPRSSFSSDGIYAKTFRGGVVRSGSGWRTGGSSELGSPCWLSCGWTTDRSPELASAFCFSGSSSLEVRSSSSGIFSKVSSPAGNTHVAFILSLGVAPCNPLWGRF